MPSKLPNKNELRTKETRDLLLRSAETIFVRDGYEGAELGEIASLAGRTKGAIYAHFENKEDLFIALFAERMRLYADRMLEMLASSTSIEQNLQIFRKFYLATLEDKNWLLWLRSIPGYRPPLSSRRSKPHYTETQRSMHGKSRFLHTTTRSSCGERCISMRSAMKQNVWPARLRESSQS
jgi:AcrR family transcriptional regulator